MDGFISGPGLLGYIDTFFCLLRFSVSQILSNDLNLWDGGGLWILELKLLNPGDGVYFSAIGVWDLLYKVKKEL